MKPALMLIDLQNDFLNAPGLTPCREALCANIATLLKSCRLSGVPVAHVWTTIQHPDERMPHWKKMGKDSCREGTPGHATPEPLRPIAHERVIHKRFFSAFGNAECAPYLRELGADTLILAGIYTRGCIRQTALDAYSRGFDVWIVAEGIADNDPLHAEVTRSYLDGRAARFGPLAEILKALPGGKQTSVPINDHEAAQLAAMITDRNPTLSAGLRTILRVSPREKQKRLPSVPVCTAKEVSIAAEHTRRTSESFPADHKRWDVDDLARAMNALEKLLVRRSAEIERALAEEIGKPVRETRAEISFAVGLLRSSVEQATAPCNENRGDDWIVRWRPHGTVLAVTPWNNPLAIPLGKIAPALLFGNSVIWKPSPQAAAFSEILHGILLESGVPANALALVQGDGSTAARLMEHPAISAVSLTGSSGAGIAAQVICARRRLPLQAELGGNNAAIVWPDADLKAAAGKIALGAFGFAGQRCTANRRVIVHEACHDEFVSLLAKCVDEMRLGDPLDAQTQVGPVVSESARQRIECVIQRARDAGCEVIQPHADRCAELSRQGFYVAPTILCYADPSAEAVQEETFGPLVVVQKASDWDHAIRLVNGVPQGLTASLFSGLAELRQRFTNEVVAGMLKFEMSTAGAAPDAPFCAWKASGIGPPEHGAGDREFYARTQTLYGIEPLNQKVDR